MKMEQTECSETSAHKIQTPENNPEERIHYLKHFSIMGLIYSSTECRVFHNVTFFVS